MLSENTDKLKKLKFWGCIMAILAATFLQAQPGDGPPGAVPGKCYAKCYVPDQYQRSPEPMILGAPDEKLIADPAVIQPVEIEIITREAGVRYTIREPVLEPASRKVLLKEAEKVYTVTPPVFESGRGKGRTEPVVVPVAVPAVVETVETAVEVSPAYVRYRAFSTEYETVQHNYAVEPEYQIITLAEPRYETINERVEIKPPSTQWVRKPGDPNCLRNDPNDCFIWCLVETPAEYQNISRTVNRGCDNSRTPNGGCVTTSTVPAKNATIAVEKVKSPGELVADTVPAVYKMVKQQVVTSPAYIRYDTLYKEKRRIATPAVIQESLIPATYQLIDGYVLKTPADYHEEIIPETTVKVKVRSLVRDAVVRRESLPPAFTTINRMRLIRRGGFMEWREVVCGERLTAATIGLVQEKLKTLGYYKGRIDQKMTPAFRKALEKFQLDKGLPGGELTVETLSALGL